MKFLFRCATLRPLLILILVLPAALVLNAQQQVAILAADTGLAFDVDHASQDNGGAVRQQRYEKGDNQHWDVIEVEEDVYRFQAVHSGKYLTAPQNGAVGVIQQGIKHDGSQEFIKIDLGNNECHLMNVGTGKYLMVAKSSKEPGYRILIANPDGTSKAQRFELHEVYQYVNRGRPAAPRYYGMTVTNKSMWEVSFRVQFSDGYWSSWKTIKVGLNSPSGTVTGKENATIYNYEIQWKDLTTWREIPGGTPIIPDNSSMAITITGNSLTGIKAN